MGFKALFSGSSSYSNSVVGYQSGMSITTGSNNSALGYGSLESLTTGGNNVLVLIIQHFKLLIVEKTTILFWRVW